MPGERVLVPVSSSSTLRATVDYVVEGALAEATPDAPAVVRFVYVHAPEEFDVDVSGTPATAADELLDRVEVWAEEDAGDDADALTVETGQLGADRYLFSAADVGDALLADAESFGADRIVLDPEYDPGVGQPLLDPLMAELDRVEERMVEVAPVQPEVRRAPFPGATSALRIGLLFGVAFVFYQALGGGISGFDLVTGAVSATIVAVSLSRVSLGRDPGLVQTPVRLLRGAVYVPYLLWEIVKANVVVAAVILNPRLPIDPRLTRIRPAVYGALPVTSLANSITLTPGTLTVRVEGRSLLVHTLVPSAREDLFDGGLERGIRFLFYGRRAMRVEGLRDRDAASIVPANRVGTDAGWTHDGDAPPAVGGDDETDEAATDDGGDPS